MPKHKLTNITSSNSLTEISRGHLNSFLNSSNSDLKCSSKCKTIKSSCSTTSSSSSSSSCKKNKSHKSHKSHKSSREPSGCKSKYVTSTYTTTNSSCPSISCSNSSSCSSSSCSSSSCPSSSCSSSWTCGTTAGCPASFTNSSSNSSSSCNPCKVNCNAYALKCNTYKSLSGTMLIPGPQGPSSGCLANMSANNNSSSNLTLTQVGSSSLYSIKLANFTGVSISSSSNTDTFTFYLTGTYLFQYNVNVTVDTSSNLELLLNSTTPFGVQTIPAQTGCYGCSVIYEIVAGNYVNLVIDNVDANITFASLTIIKL